jgi:hypothetical protein
MKDKTRLVIAGVIVTLAVALFVLGMIVLPDTLVMQMKTNGAAGTTLPKLIGLLIPLALSAVFAVLYYKGNKGNNLLVAVIGLLTFGLTFFFNR